VLLYVDDVLIITYNAETMTNFKAFLMQQFRMIDLKQISLFLGIRIIRSENEITLDQTIFLKNILIKFNMSDCKPVATPLPVQINYEELNSNISYNAPCKKFSWMFNVCHALYTTRSLCSNKYSESFSK
jgi:hypothetical protein